jgi:hypothetical protein
MNKNTKTLAERKKERAERRTKRLQGTKTKVKVDPFTRLNPEE